MDSLLSSLPRQIHFAALVGGVVARRRRAAGLNQTELARVVEMNQAGWSKIERGVISLSLEYLTLVAPALGVEPAVILDEAERVARYVEGLGVQVARHRQVRSEVEALAAWIEAALGG